LVPVGLELELGRIGFHTFRHSYRAWLDETGAPVGVQQKLMRHAHISTTMDQYGNASMLAKRKANRPVVQRLLRRAANQPFAVQ
jgi:integrase